MTRRPPRSTLFPYTPLSRSRSAEPRRPVAAAHDRARTADTADAAAARHEPGPHRTGDRKSTRLNSSHANISYAVFCLKKKKKKVQVNMEIRKTECNSVD